MKYVDFYFYACMDELFAVKDSYWKSNLHGNEVEELAEFLGITLDKEYIIKTYKSEHLSTIDIFHSKNNDSVFLYFDLRRMPTDLNDMFFFGLRCEAGQKTELMEKLLSIYDTLKTTGSFSYEKWGWKLLGPNNAYLILKGDYESAGEIIHHRN